MCIRRYSAATEAHTARVIDVLQRRIYSRHALKNNHDSVGEFKVGGGLRCGLYISIRIASRNFSRARAHRLRIVFVISDG